MLYPFELRARLEPKKDRAIVLQPIPGSEGWKPWPTAAKQKFQG